MSIINSQEAKESLNEVRKTAHFHSGHNESIIPAHECVYHPCADITAVVHWIATEEDRLYDRSR